MARRNRDRHLVNTNYAVDWSGHGNPVSQGFMPPTKDAAVQHAAERIAEMREGGFKSPIRSVEVRHWPDGGKLADAPLILRASYYDTDQCLTPAEESAARVHDWHALTDRTNRHLMRSNSKWLMGYRAWQATWGEVPTACPVCQSDLVNSIGAPFPPGVTQRPLRR